MKNIILAILGIGFMVLVVMIFGKDQNQETQTGGMITNGPVLALSESVWVWDKTLMNDDTTIIPQKSGAFSISFTKDGNVSGTTDCNGFSGTYTLSGEGVITFGPIASTKMFCEGSQEQVFLNYLSTEQRVFFDEAGNLVLLLPYDSGSIIFKKQ